MVKRWEFPELDVRTFARPPRPDEPTLLHTFEGVCTRCGGEHNIDLLNEPDAQAKASALFDRLPESTLDRALMSSSEHLLNATLGAFREFGSEIAKRNRDGPAIRAVADVLDEMTDGAVSRRWEVYSAEADLLLVTWLHQMTQRFVELITSRYGTVPGVIDRFFNVMITTLADERERLRQVYLELCQRHDRQPDASVLTDGHVDADRSPMTRWYGWEQLNRDLPVPNEKDFPTFPQLRVPSDP